MFVKTGRLLGDQREMELLVGGFSPLEAIHIARENGAGYDSVKLIDPVKGVAGIH